MKKVLFLIVVLFVAHNHTHNLSAQEFVLQKENVYVNRGKIKSEDSCVYKIREYDQLLERFGTEESIKDVRYFATTEDYNYWFKWVCARVLPEEIIPFIEKANSGGPYIYTVGWLSLPMNCYKGLMIEVFFDKDGNIITMSFYVAEEIRDKVKNNHLKQMYNAIKKYKIPEEIMRNSILSSSSETNSAQIPDCFWTLVEIGRWLPERSKYLKARNWQEIKEMKEEERKKLDKSLREARENGEVFIVD